MVCTMHNATIVDHGKLLDEVYQFVFSFNSALLLQEFA